MNLLKYFPPTGSVFLGLAFLLLLAPRATAQSSDSLPEEPRPAASIAAAAPSPLFPQSLPTQAAPHSASSIQHASVAKRKWAQYIDPGEKIPPLSAKDKILFSFHRTFTPSALLPDFTSAGFGQLTGGDPKYGVDKGAFGDRLGGDALRQLSMRFFVLGVIPAIDRSDPRYLRKASGSIKSRIGWAAERAYINQRDSGRPGFNDADLLGHLAASYLTMAYYPGPSVKGTVVLKTFLTSIAGTTGNNEFLEFWPDVINLWHRHRQHVRASHSSSAP